MEPGTLLDGQKVIRKTRWFSLSLAYGTSGDGRGGRGPESEGESSTHGHCEEEGREEEQGEGMRGDFEVLVAVG